MDGGAWWATVQGVAKSRTRLSDFTHFIRETSLISIPQIIRHLLSQIPGFSRPKAAASVPKAAIKVDSGAEVRGMAAGGHGRIGSYSEESIAGKTEFAHV